jgi:hypothetical protein
MARHPEVSDKAIIQAGKEIEKLGKKPNPGSIRAQLGFKGGLARIKTVWNAFERERNFKLIDSEPVQLSLDALPVDYAKNATQLISKLSDALEQMMIEAYQHSQTLFDKRLKILDSKYQEKDIYYSEYEQAADSSIKKLEYELYETSAELKQLADQNAKLLLENSRLIGRLSVFESTHQSNLKTS